jgi:hypothetical protein
MEEVVCLGTDRRFVLSSRNAYEGVRVVVVVGSFERLHHGVDVCEL